MGVPFQVKLLALKLKTSLVLLARVVGEASDTVWSSTGFSETQLF